MFLPTYWMKLTSTIDWLNELHTHMVRKMVCLFNCNWCNLFFHAILSRSLLPTVYRWRYALMPATCHQMWKVVTHSQHFPYTKVLSLTCATMEKDSWIKRNPGCPHCGLATVFTCMYHSASAERQTLINTKQFADNHILELPNEFGSNHNLELNARLVGYAWHL